jgi:hypothetical protein
MEETIQTFFTPKGERQGGGRTDFDAHHGVRRTIR